MRTILAISTAILLAGCTGEAPIDDTAAAINGGDLAPSGRGFITRDAAAQAQAGSHGGGGTSSNGISYHGGPVMLGTVNIYYIWYGSWAGNSATTILTNFISNLGGSAYEHINTTYYDGSNTHVSGLLNYVSSYSTSAYLGTSLTDAQIQQVVSDAIAGNHLPKDTNGLYFVLTSADVTASSGFCTQYCGWHTHGTIAGSDIK
ncbi:MAG TPA: hypothetical protein VF997_10995, partial [Polyangia bacterium]